MILCVITPVGPGHDIIVDRTIDSVLKARTGPFSIVRHEIVYDHEGKLGRSRARNIGMDVCPEADWYFFVDADDRMRSDALLLNDFDSAATFGAVSLDGKVISDVWPCTWRDIALRGAVGTLSMGFFCKGELARSLRFNEDMDAGEDYEFYMRLPCFTKRSVPLVDIGYLTASAGGPRGYVRIDWAGICNTQIAEAVKRAPEKFDLRGDAVLAKVRDPAIKLGSLPQTVP